MLFENVLFYEQDGNEALSHLYCFTVSLIQLFVLQQHLVRTSMPIIRTNCLILIIFHSSAILQYLCWFSRDPNAVCNLFCFLRFHSFTSYKVRASGLTANEFWVQPNKEFYFTRFSNWRCHRIIIIICTGESLCAQCALLGVKDLGISVLPKDTLICGQELGRYQEVNPKPWVYRQLIITDCPTCCATVAPSIQHFAKNKIMITKNHCSPKQKHVYLYFIIPQIYLGVSSGSRPAG